MRYLFSCAIGPVQDFIAAARRTRDFTFGSELLSELSKAAAFEILRQGGVLIFPGGINQTQLQNQRLNVANKLLFEWQGDYPETLSGAIHQAIQDHWLEICNSVLDQIQDWVHRDLWARQVQDAFEFYAAWCPWAEEQPYADIRQQVERLLAGRKALRDFEFYQGMAGIPKSSLDGLRESVLKPFDHPPPPLRRARLKSHESLDVLGVVKRLGKLAESRDYPSVSRLAVQPWIEGVRTNPEASQALDAFQELCRGVEEIHRLRLPQFSAFPFEGAVLFEEWLAGDEFDFQDPALRAELQRALKTLYKAAGSPPFPYYALLLADGDRMGDAISRQNSADEHRRLSQALSAFADQEVPNLIAQNKGFLVYSGGDDVLAFLPLHRCLQAANQLRQAFQQAMQPFGDGQFTPTLSVGIAIAHCMEPMEDTLALVRQAEKRAKNPLFAHEGHSRNGLALALKTRSGGEKIILRSNWEQNPHLRWLKWIALHLNEQISDKAAYDLRALAHFYLGWPADEIHTMLEEGKNIVHMDALRLLKRKRSGSGQPIDTKDIAALLTSPTATPLDAEGLNRIASELLLTRHLARAFAQAKTPVLLEEGI